MRELQMLAAILLLLMRARQTDTEDSGRAWHGLSLFLVIFALLMGLGAGDLGVTFDRGSGLLLLTACTGLLLKLGAEGQRAARRSV